MEIFRIEENAQTNGRLWELSRWRAGRRSLPHRSKFANFFYMSVSRGVLLERLEAANALNPGSDPAATR